MEYILCKKLDIDQMCNLRKSVGWNELKTMMSNPKMDNLFNIICTENSNIVGFLAVVSNNVTDAYIQDVMVAPKFQGKGVGTELMNRAISEIKARGIYMISVIYGEEKLHHFYENLDFVQCFAVSWKLIWKNNGIHTNPVCKIGKLKFLEVLL